MNAASPASVSPFKIAAAYIGTVIGAGFASGQEVLRFFGAYGLSGIFGIAVSSALFFFIGHSVLTLGHTLRARSHVDIVRYTNGRLLGATIDMIITIFMFGGLCTMIAGAGAIFREQFAVSPIWGTLALAVVAMLTVMAGAKGVLNANSAIVPFLIVSMLAICIISLTQNPAPGSDIGAEARLQGATPHWLLSAVNYASYNIVISIGVLGSIGAVTESRRTLFRGALLGAIGLAAGMTAIYFCLLTRISDVIAREVPMIEIAGQISGFVRTAFAVALFGAVYTTAVGNLYGFALRIPPKLPRTAVIAVTTLLAFIVGQLGFSNLVRYLYPAVGYGGLLFFAGVVHARFFRHSIRPAGQKELP